MREQLVNLLLEEFKTESVFYQLKEIGISSKDIEATNLFKVFDMIGFPDDNVEEYDHGFIASDGEIRDETKKMPDKYMFSRGYYAMEYFMRWLEKDGGQTLLNKEIRNDPTDKTIIRIINKYLDWLYVEYEEWRDEMESGDEFLLL
jgi:hypothetical protein